MSIIMVLSSKVLIRTGFLFFWGSAKRIGFSRGLVYGKRRNDGWIESI
jgi:hypothetical protein